MGYLSRKIGAYFGRYPLTYEVWKETGGGYEKQVTSCRVNRKGGKRNTLMTVKYGEVPFPGNESRHGSTFLVVEPEEEVFLPARFNADGDIEVIDEDYKTFVDKNMEDAHWQYWDKKQGILGRWGTVIAVVMIIAVSAVPLYIVYDHVNKMEGQLAKSNKALLKTAESVERSAELIAGDVEGPASGQGEPPGEESSSSGGG